jgi:membrane associated rhomboid family serine protease
VVFPLHDDNPRHGPAVVMWILVAVNVAMFLFQNQLNNRDQFLFILDYGFIPSQFFAAPVREIPNLISSAFLHGSPLHLASNMFFLYVFGDNVENRLGHFGFLGFYLLGSVIAGLVHANFSDSSSVPMVGASGAVSAVMGAYILLFPRRKVLTLITPLFVPWLVFRLFMRVPRFFLPWLPAWVFIGYWALIQTIKATNTLVQGSGVSAENVAWWAHVGGFAVGLATVLVASVFWKIRQSAP